MCGENVPISLDVINEIKNSICKIKVTSKSYYGTGFFMIINSKYYLITN